MQQIMVIKDRDGHVLTNPECTGKMNGELTKKIRERERERRVR